MTVVVQLSKVLKGDRFLYTDSNVYSELYGKTIEVLEVLKEDLSFKVSVEGKEESLPFNIL